MKNSEKIYGISISGSNLQYLKSKIEEILDIFAKYSSNSPNEEHFAIVRISNDTRLALYYNTYYGNEVSMLPYNKENKRLYTIDSNNCDISDTRIKMFQDNIANIDRFSIKQTEIVKDIKSFAYGVNKIGRDTLGIDR